MARGTTLVKLLDDLRAEARLSLNPAHNADNRPVQVKLLQRIQDRLWEDFTWPHLRISRQVAVQAGQRYYDTPEEIKIDRLEKIELFVDGGWRELEPGIAPECYGAWNSDLDERSWPPRRWEIHEGEDVEIWPISDTNGDATTREGYLKFTGIRSLNPLVADSDRAELDGRLLTLYGAAEMLAASGAKDAKLKLDQANALYMQLRSSLTPRVPISMFGINKPHRSSKIFITNYRPAGS